MATGVALACSCLLPPLASLTCPPLPSCLLLFSVLPSPHSFIRLFLLTHSPIPLLSPCSLRVLSPPLTPHCPSPHSLSVPLPSPRSLGVPSLFPYPLYSTNKMLNPHSLYSACALCSRWPMLPVANKTATHCTRATQPVTRAHSPNMVMSPRRI